MRNIFYKLLIISIFTGLVACGNKEYELITDANADSPVIGEIAVSTPVLTYGEKSEISFEVRGDTEISHARVLLKIDNALVSEKVIPVVAKTMQIADSLFVPFKEYCLNKTLTITVEAMNKAIKTAGKELEYTIVRPNFDKLYFITTEGHTHELLPSAEDYVFEADGDFGQQISGYIYSSPNKMGYMWGFGAATNKGELASTVAFELEDSAAPTVTKISFDAVSFAISPLKRVMSINGIELMTDANNANIRTATLNLTKNETLTIVDIDTQEVMFDPIYFSQQNGEIRYTGETGNCKMIFHTDYNFIFVQNSENTITGNGEIYINGWGIGLPDLWHNNPDWNFENSIVFAQRGENLFEMSLVASKWASFKFYTDKDWNYEIKPNQMTFDDAVFAAQEEDGKPGNYNIIYANPATTADEIIVKILYNAENKSLASEVLKEL
ncbi:MAG: DUF5121 domain-containing protein [Prevotellaceae bacterium]|jgi:hypothetical protein|nr:DUF5121 domain-containing protein [Prevotellaceae bacterium]